MSSGLWAWCARGLVWSLRRNPLYLLSAACMAVGARLYLVCPDSPAGDIGLILLTLGVLQAYEWAVTTILLALHRSRRSPEDEPSLLLVAALFWTGPLAATVELSARQAHPGTLCAVGVLVFALAELCVVRRELALPLSRSGRVLALACLALLVLAPRVLRVDDTATTHELFLYFCWWLLAACTLLAIPALRAHEPSLQTLLAMVPGDTQHPSPRAPRVASELRALRIELAFLGTVVAATATHFWAMNYAFYGHARAFYAAPVLLVLSLVGFDAFARWPGRRGVAVALLALVPALAVGLALQPFHPDVPAHVLPVGVRDPLLVTLVGAALVWWCGAARLRSAGLFHLGNLAFAATVLRAARTLPLPVTPAVPGVDGLAPRDLLTGALLLLSAYLLCVALVRRSRAEAVLGLVLVELAACTWAWERTEAVFTIGTVACWCVLSAAHLGVRPPGLAVLLWPALGLVALAWYAELDNSAVWAARLQLTGLASALLVVGWLRRSPRERALGVAVIAVNVLFYGGRGAAAGPNPVATLVMLGSFVLLVGGALVSWHKTRLLALARATPTSAGPETERTLEV